MKFKVIFDIEGNFQVKDIEEDFDITCPFCDNIDIYRTGEDTDLYCSKCGKLLVIKGKGKTCFDFDDITKLKNVIKRGTSMENRRNAIILLGRAIEWCEDVTLAEYLLHLSVTDPDKWIREKAGQILNQQREVGSAKVRSEIKKLKEKEHSPLPLQPVSSVPEDILPEITEEKEIPSVNKIQQSQEKNKVEKETVSEEAQKHKKGKLVDIFLELIEDENEEELTETIKKEPSEDFYSYNNMNLIETDDEEEDLPETMKGKPSEDFYSHSITDLPEVTGKKKKKKHSKKRKKKSPEDHSSNNIMDLLEIAMDSIASTKEVLEKTHIDSDLNIDTIIENNKLFTLSEEIDEEEPPEEIDEENTYNLENESFEEIDLEEEDDFLEKPLQSLLDGITPESLIEEFVIEETVEGKADILFILGEMKVYEATEFLLEILINDSEYILRNRALEGLIKIGNKNIATKLLKAMKREKDGNLRKKIAQFYSTLKYK
ncbi:MAG: hypothetical protein BWY64_01511 [bacterium ADurb.Bin363]|nr:MAG: hypothetical protein BWY64_01505 [bacterium ADurb.Bin363]OQA18411.1 MAG: hypothetical protein BWY64_01511 [bacterium ADurb.Bin363]